MADVSASQKPARYRSQKRVDPPAQDEPALPGAPVPAVDDSVTRSKSRYRRRAPTSPGSSPPQPAQPELPQSLQNEPPSRYRSASKPLYQAHIVQTQQSPAGVFDVSENAQIRQTTPRAAAKTVQTQDMEQPSPSREAVSDAPQQLRARQSVRRPNVQEAKPRPPTPPPLLPETVPDGQLFPPPKPEEKPVRMDGPPRSDTIRATKSMSELRKVEKNSSEGGCFTLFRRKRADPAPAKERKPSMARPKTATKTDSPYIKPGGGGIVPGTDAPVSAVNAGDRRVLLEVGQSKTFFPVTPTTTPVDLLKSASLCMSEYIDVKSAVLFESFSTVGVQRPLRRYEHLRDVMNSWDSDAQNSLTLIDPGTGSIGNELTITGVPAERPGDVSWGLLYSQKPGKWEKRVVTLKSDGQITCQKDSEKAKDLVNLCHLSDFDIYTPTHERARKKIKPPKKMCYAIKSQQKSSMFESTQNFVHFFCTGDRQTADSFYAAVQEWRSWYLVNVLGEGRKAAVAPTSNRLLDTSSPGKPAKGHRANESVDSHYQLGSFQPLLDLSELERPSEITRERAISVSKPAPVSQPTVLPDVHASPENRGSLKKQHPPLAMKNKVVLAEDEPLVNFNRRSSTEKHRPSVDQKASESDEFKATGLLGRTYSQRQRDYVEKELERSQPFTEGPSLLNGGFDDSTLPRDGPRRQATHNSDLHTSKSTRDRNRNNASHTPAGSGGLARSSSQAREKPKPLLDFTPEYREPIQHAGKGRGFTVDNPGPHGLIANATSPEDVPQPSPSFLGTSEIPSSRVVSSHHARSHSLSRSNTQSRTTVPPPQPPPPFPPLDPSQHAFTGEGLLAGAHAQRGWGGGTQGRGVVVAADGYHDAAATAAAAAVGGAIGVAVTTTGPHQTLVDWSAPSAFVQNSLLHRVEREHGPVAPIIDREKRDERDVKYGEGF